MALESSERGLKDSPRPAPGGAAGAPTDTSEKTASPVEPGQQPLWRKSRFTDARIIGQYHRTYVLCEAAEGLLLVDQHAAHERILFEQFKGRSARERVDVQTLLIPETIELNYAEADALEKLIPELNRVGFEVEPFGGNTFVIKSVPAVLSGRENRPLILEIVEDAVTIGFSTGMEKSLDRSLKLMACHGAIRANQQLSERQIRQLLADLDRCDDPSHCPHGRPTWIRWSRRELEKAFNRIV